MKRLLLTSHSTLTSSLRTSLPSCQLCGAAIAHQQTRNYALSRYRDTDRSARAGSRLSRQRVVANRSQNHLQYSENTDKQGSLEASTSHLPSQQASQPSSGATPSPRTGFFSGIDQYVPVDPALANERDLGPPPVAPGDLIDLNDPAAAILSSPSLVVVRQIEMMNVFLGFEQANRYRLVNQKGEDVGFLAEQEGGFGRAMGRQVMRGHRPFSCVVMDTVGNVVLKVERPFSFINSRISIYRGDDTTDGSTKIGECQQIWHPYRRKYSLSHRGRSAENTSERSVALADAGNPDEAYEEFANIDARLLAWDFYLQSETGAVLASVNRNFMGFGRELFTDTGQYVLRFDKQVADAEVTARVEKGVGINEELQKVAAETQRAKEVAEASPDSTALVAVPPEDERGLTLDQRAILLAAAVSIDIDYFSRHGGSGMHMPMLWMPMPGAGVPAEAPTTGAEGAGVPDASTGSDAGTVASPEYGESPGLSQDYGGYGQDPYGSAPPSSDGYGQPVQGQDDVMHDPWASAGQQADSEGGGFWSSLGGLFGGDD